MKKIILIVTVLCYTLSAFSQTHLPKALKKSYLYVPSGNVILEEDTISVQSFYMYNQEVTNANYQEFLNWVDKNGTEEMKQITAIHNENWASELSQFQSDAFAEKYHSHSAYLNYPVVNVSKDAALLYCQWLEDFFAREYDLNVKVRLPLHAEFIRAGQGDHLEANYSWNGPYLRNSKGDFLANFTRIPQSTISRNENGELEIQKWSGTIAKSSDLVAPSISYFPSEYGFYNLNGNVAEMIAETGIAVGGSWMDYGYDIRLQSRKKYETSSCLVGFRPVFTVMK
ncbi:MAG: SUMF1/EgtB/PvdO family nonheme iron enzyme [Crocinitomicaceae bacterium]|nr:SUMF1/EgtB/PvdO family nonheme iron enzyme [Crocinitomicaceae bacterium]